MRRKQEIISHAGEIGAVTIATNMAGVVPISCWKKALRNWEALKSSEQNATSHAVLITSCADVPDVRETRENPSSICLWKTTHASVRFRKNDICI